jgi:hypothetical protein
MPGFDGATAWLNSEPLTPVALRGGAVVVQFWTYTCINWLRTLPYIRAWNATYRDQGLVVVGVHTPEFEVEHDLDNVRRAIGALGIDYPIAVDNDYAIWNAFANRYWPATYLVDGAGVIRGHQFGEGRYHESEALIQRLVRESGQTVLSGEGVPVVGAGAEAPADWSSLNSAETYLCYRRAERFASPGGAAPNLARTYVAPERLTLNQWALFGNWTIGGESARTNDAGGRISYRFHARDLHLVMGAGGEEVEFRVLVDGEPPGGAHGVDVDALGRGVVSFPRLYQLVRQPGPIVDRSFEIEFLGRGVEAYVFTFG